ncbi:MAG: acyl--CoA ligase [Myxococcales bacterium]|nr:acyl--CoA ligase [Myxococcales bacterium]
MRKTLGPEELAERAHELGARLRQTSGTPLALLAGNGPAALVGRHLANVRKAPLVPVNPLLRPGEIAHILRDSQAPNLLCERNHAACAEAAIAALDGQRPKLVVMDEEPLASGEVLIFEGARMPGKSASAIGDEDIGATLIYTSGTTGQPKGCFRTAAQEAARARELASTYGLTSKDVQLIACPLAHSAPGMFVRAAHAMGTRSIIFPRFGPATFRAAWQKYQGSFFFLVPTQYRRLLDNFASGAPSPWAPPASTRAALVAGAPLSDELRVSVMDWLGPKRLWQFYGSTETGTISIARPGSTSEGGVGTLAPGVEVQVRGERGELCPSGVVGEMFVRSPTLMSGYWPGKSIEDAEGYVSVGDLGFITEAGALHLVDRKNDTIITGGVNVYPAEVEAALLAIDGVDAAVVVGLDDDDWGQRVVGLIASSSAITEKLLREKCRETLAPYKIPKEVHFLPLEDMPIGASGKPLRRRAREIIER